MLRHITIVILFAAYDRLSMYILLFGNEINWPQNAEGTC